MLYTLHDIFYSHIYSDFKIALQSVIVSFTAFCLNVNLFCANITSYVTIVWKAKYSCAISYVKEIYFANLEYVAVQADESFI